jgi:hypothetical protein
MKYSINLSAYSYFITITGVSWGIEEVWLPVLLRRNFETNSGISENFRLSWYQCTRSVNYNICQYFLIYFMRNLM